MRYVVPLRFLAPTSWLRCVTILGNLRLQSKTPCGILRAPYAHYKEVESNVMYNYYHTSLMSYSTSGYFVSCGLNVTGRACAYRLNIFESMPRARVTVVCTGHAR